MTIQLELLMPTVLPNNEAADHKMNSQLGYSAKLLSPAYSIDILEHGQLSHIFDRSKWLPA